jgi:hypothetical protein
MEKYHRLYKKACKGIVRVSTFVEFKSSAHFIPACKSSLRSINSHYPWWWHRISKSGIASQLRKYCQEKYTKNVWHIDMKLSY